MCHTISYLYRNVATDPIIMKDSGNWSHTCAKHGNHSQLVRHIMAPTHSTNHNDNVYSHSHIIKGYSWHTIFELYSFIIRVKSFVYIQAS